MLAEGLLYTHSRYMEQKIHRRLASNQQGVLPPEAPANHAMTMDPGEVSALGEHNILASTSGASGYDDPWTVGDWNTSFAAEHDYWSQLFVGFL